MNRRRLLQSLAALFPQTIFIARASPGLDFSHMALGATVSGEAALLAEPLIVFTVRDQRNPDPMLAPGGYDRGDVIEVLPDGWRFSERELTHPGWRIVHVTGWTVEQANQLKTHGPPRWAGQFANRAPLRRLAYLEVEHPAIPAPLAAWLEDDARAEPIRPWPAALLRSVMRHKKLPDDPTVIGSTSNNVIG